MAKAKDDSQVTIKMPKKSLKAWVSALRSGKYRRGTGALKDEHGGYCCLGVLEHCLTGEVEGKIVKQPWANGKEEFESNGMPSKKWLAKHDIKFRLKPTGKFGELAPGFSIFDSYDNEHYWQSAADVNDSKTDLKDKNGIYKGQRSKYTFKQIADWIEKHAIGI